MRFPNNALVGLLLLLGPLSSTGAFLSSSGTWSSERQSRTTTSYFMARSDVALSPLPLPLETSPSKKHKVTRRQRRRQPNWKGQSIPKDIPKLSDILKDASVEDFTGKVDVTPTQKNANQHEQRPANATNATRNSRNVGKKAKKQKRLDAHSKLGEAWRATYSVSTQTQSRIKAVANSMSNRRPIESATSVLKTLLDTPPEKCNEANVVCALTLSARAMNSSTVLTDEFRSLLMATLEVLRQLVADERLNARQLCNAVWAIAKHYNVDPSILPSPPEMTAMPSEDMVGVAEAWILQDASENSAEQRAKETVEMIAMQITKLLQTEETSSKQKIKLGEICMATWAYGVLGPRRRPPGWPVPPRIGHVPRSPRRARNQQSVEVVTFAQWAQDEENEYKSPADVIDRFFDAVGEKLCREESLHIGDELVVSPPILRNCSWSEIANVAWAFAHHGYCQTASSEKVLQGLAEEATHRLQNVQQDEGPWNVLPRDIAQLVWAIGVLQSDNFRLSDSLVHLVDAVAHRYGLVEGRDEPSSRFRPLIRWSFPDLVQLSISLAHGRIDQLPLLRALYNEAYLRLLGGSSSNHGPQHSRERFLAWEVSVLLWAQARLFLRNEEGEMFGDFAAEASKWLAETVIGSSNLEDIGIGPQEQANLAWSLTVLEEYYSPEAIRLLQQIFQEASFSSKENHIIQLEHAHQLWQALFLLEDPCPAAVENVPKWFREFLHEKWKFEKARRKKSSARHRSLSQTLELMGVAHYNEHDEDIDMAIVLKDECAWTHMASRSDHDGAKFKVAVEFDGPNHFTREKQDGNGTRVQPRTLGHTVLKYRLLKKQGWAVVRVPYYEYDKIPFWASMERQRYLQRLLKTHECIRFSEVDVSVHQALVPNRKSRFD